MPTGTKEQRAKKKTDPLHHLEGCPENADRVEVYEDRQVTGELRGQLVEVTRCQDCGAHMVRNLEGARGEPEQEAT